MTDETPPTPVPPSGGSFGASSGASPGAIPAERARIEPSPPAKRLDALPVLYLVGFVILAASLIYLWKHPALPRGAALEVARMDTLREQINAIQGRVDKLETRPAPAIPDMAPLTARVAELEHRPVPAMPEIQSIETRLAALESRPPPITDLRPIEARLGALESKPPVDLKPLDARLGTLEAKPPVDLKPLETRLATLEAKPPVDLGPLQSQVEAASRKSADDAAALGKRIDAADAQGKQTAASLSDTTSKLAAVAQKAALAGRLQSASAALEAGQRLGEIPGAPPALARFAHDAPPTEAGLRLSFDQAADNAHRVSQPAITDNQPLLNRMWTKAQQSVTVRQGDRVLLGDPIAGVLTQARQALDAGDLVGAVKALDGLAGPAKEAMSDWVSQARSLIEARAAIGELAGRG